MLRPEHGFSQQNKPERGQLQDCYADEKMMMVPVCLNDNVVLRDVWVLYRFRKDEDDEFLPVLAFRRDVVNAIFLKYSKEGRLSSTHVGIRNISSDVCYDDTKHYQVQSEHRRTQNLFKYLRWSVFA